VKTIDRRAAPSRHTRNFHGLKAEYAEHSIDRAVLTGRISHDDAGLVREFITEMKATKGISQSRSNKLTYTLVQWRSRSFVGSFRTNTITDLYQGIERLKYAAIRGKPYKQNTIRDFIGALKRFYLWLCENAYVSVSKEKIQKIKTPARDTMTKTAEQLLTEDEVKAMIEVCQNSRDRALLAVLYEGAFRIEELGRLTWGQVKFDDYGVVLNVNEKTSRVRYIRLVASTQYLIAWKNDYPFEISPNTLVFLSYKHQPLEYAAINMQFKKIGKRAGITKRITPHLFRHSRITHMLQKGYSESIIKKVCWGNINTTMFETYVHLTDSDIDNEILEKQGIHRHETRPTQSMKARQCINCNTINAPTQQFCSLCGEPLTKGMQIHMERLKADIEKTQEYKIIMNIVRQQLSTGS
jgi:integrase/recombinase XerD